MASIGPKIEYIKGMPNVYSGFIKIDFNEFKKALDNENWVF